MNVRYANSARGELSHIRDADGNALCGRARLLEEDVEDNEDLEVCYYCVCRHQEAEEELV